MLAPSSAQAPYPPQQPYPAPATPYPQQQAPYPNQPARNPVCVRLESQLAIIDRGPSGDPARMEQIRRYEDAARRQQADIDRLSQQARRYGCDGLGFFALFSGQSAQCGPINNQMQQMRGNLDRLLTELQRLQGNTADREAQRRPILTALAQNDCGPQYRQYASQGFFEGLFGPGTIVTPPSTPTAPMGDTYRTVCVRTCDGYYFPISNSASPARFGEDEKMCHRLCPAAETMLFTYRSQGQDINQAVSISGQPYTQLPNAFNYRKTFNPACTCKPANETWAEALKQLDDPTVERGDIVVNSEEQARRLSQPQSAPQGKPARTPANASPAKNVPAPAEATTAPSPDTSAEESDPSKRKVRSVGPAFYPVR